ncbi:MAG TPA: SurA N-terminal domain-containing protein [Pyrinomonadaceae bacterium]|jgi:peptidyl-prolyl cis-trans isomerase D
MLKFFSRLERTRGLIIVIFAVMMAVSLVIFYAPGRNSASMMPASSTEVLARVGGEDVTVGDLQTLKDSYMQMFGGQISLAQLGGDKRFLDGLIRDRIIAQEAARLGLAASDAEVADKIRKEFKDASGKFVGFDRYKESVVGRYGSIERFERQIRDQIAAEKLQAFVTAGVRVSDAEVQDDYRRKNTTFQVVYVPVTADKLAQKIQPSDEELRAFFDQHKTEYRILEPQRKVRYLFINQAKAGEKLQISDDDLRKEYDKLAPERKQAGVRVQQIVLKVARPDLDAQVRQKAENLATQLRAAASGGAVTEEAFATAAKGNSEDAATAQQGGYLPAPVKRNPNKPDPLYDRMLELQEGEMTEAFKQGNNYYIMRRGAPVPKTFEDAKPELIAAQRNSRAYAIAAQLASRAEARLKETKDFQKVAQELAPEANMTPADMIKETPYVKPGDDVPGIGNNQNFSDAIAALQNPNDVGTRTGVRDGFAIPMLLDKREPRIPEFEEVKDKVAQALKQERAKQQLEQKTNELASSAASAADLKTAAEKLGLEAKTEDNYKLGTPLGEAGTSPAADDAIFNLKEGEVTRPPVKIGDNWVVIGATKRTEADLTEFAKQRDQLMQSALSARRNQVFDDYITNLQATMQRDGKITIYKDVLAKVSEDEPVAAPPRRAPPRIPGQQ